MRHGGDILRSSDGRGLCRLPGLVDGLDELSAKGETFQVLRMPDISPNGVALHLLAGDRAVRLGSGLAHDITERRGELSVPLPLLTLAAGLPLLLLEDGPGTRLGL